MKFFPIVFTCDDMYFKYTNVVITSILKNSNSAYQYEINIISEGISPENQSKAKKQIAKYKNFSIRFHILKNFEHKQFFLNSYMSASTYYRFHIPEIFKDYERILYLDSDIIVDKDISELAEMDFDDKLAICCPSPYIHNRIKQNDHKDYNFEYFSKVLKMPDPLAYFNAGMMVYNIQKVNQSDISRKLFNSLNEIRKPHFQDQDLLNSVFSRNGGVKLIDQKYNNPRMYKVTISRLIFNSLKRIPKKSGKNRLFYIYHFVGANKPWKSQRPDQNLFEYYAVKSPFLKEIIKENHLKINGFKKCLFKVF